MPRFSLSALKAIEILESAGYSAYIVGGAVRDYLLGSAPHDTDIATSATPRQTLSVFENYPKRETGVRYGTVTVFIDSVPLEITTYRTESAYIDHRRPGEVSFARDLREDLSRRDFTVNSLAYNPREGIVDYFGGRQDIKNRVVRCVGDPERRFSEDYLRMFRAVRFSALEGFSMDKGTQDALRSLLPNLSLVAPERVYREFLKLLPLPGRGRVILDYTDVFSVFIPELSVCKGFDQKNRHHIYDVLTHTSRVVDALRPDPLLRFAGLLHDIGKPRTFTLDENGEGHFYGHREKSFEISRRVLHSLRAPGRDTEVITHLVKYHDTTILPGEKYMRRALHRHGEENLRLLLELKRADNSAQNVKDYDRSREYDALERTLDKVIAEGQCFKIKQLALDGRDIIRLGLPSSPRVGTVLEALLDMVIEGEAENTKEALTPIAHGIIEAHSFDRPEKRTKKDKKNKKGGEL